MERMMLLAGLVREISEGARRFSSPDCCQRLPGGGSFLQRHHPGAQAPDGRRKFGTDNVQAFDCLLLPSGVAHCSLNLQGSSDLPILAYQVARTTDCSRRESRSQGCRSVSVSFTMNLEPPKAEFRSATRVAGGPVTPRKGPPKFKQRQTRQFKSKPPKKGVQGFGDDIPGMEGLGTDITVICPWEAFNHLELHELAQYGII
nr:uncharacterized protein LOC129461908 isoform X3 [Symphalangus syndactylus]